MKLGNFSVSLAVKNLTASRAFYEKLGFTAFHDQSDHNWIVLKNGNCTIGLFQGMFEGNILTFNPGWDENGQKVMDYQDVREIQQELKAENIELVSEADEGSTGPASLMVKDPDGNVVLLDQHV